MAKVKAWKVGSPGEPSFPDDYEIVKRAVLQVTDIKTNHNKYYGIELHSAPGGKFRVFTHYGRTDDLEKNPNAGVRETRHLASLAQAEGVYQQIYRQKTSPRKGYKELSLASTKIGSPKAVGQSSGEMDAQTLGKTESGTAKKVTIEQSKLPPQIQDLTRYLYSEATHALTTTVAAKITAKGIETPLGVLTIGQIEKGEAILAELYDEYQAGMKNYGKMTDLSSEFFTVIPHRIGRSRKQIQEAIIDTLPEFEEKQTTLQLMKDMLTVNGEGGDVLYKDEVDSKYEALGAEIEYLDHSSSEYKEIAESVVKSQVKTKHIKVRNIYRVKRPAEWAAFNAGVGNEKMLYHGSRIQNWVGLLTRGILLPKIVVSMGVNRTDAGWLGHGIYFGDAACTSLFYTTPGKRKTRLMCIARVAMGKIKDFTKITYGLNEPPKGYDSCHGVRRKPGVKSQFDDDEYVIYRTDQQRMEYLVEFSG